MRKGVFNNILEGHLEKCIVSPQYQYEGVLSIRGAYQKVYTVKAFSKEGNYDSNMFEITKMMLLVPASVAVYAMRLGYEDMTLSLTKRVNGKVISTKTYVAKATNTEDVDMGAISREMANAERMDNETIAVVVVELLDKLAWQLRTRSVGGPFHETNALDVARYLLKKNQLDDTLSTSDFNYSINYVDKPPKNYECIIIEEGKRFLEVFDFLQNRYGIYSKGLGIFLYKQTWELFEPYNPTKFDEGGERLVIYNVPTDEMMAPDRNFYREGDVYYIAATGDSKVINSIDDVAVNEGTGIRFADIRSLENRGVGDSNNIDPRKYLTEVNTNPRENMTNAPMLAERYTDNPLKASSELFRRRGAVVTVQWENGLYDALKPGMGIELIYPQSNSIKRVKGTLLASSEYSEVEGGGIMEKQHRNTISLTLLVFPHG